MGDTITTTSDNSGASLNFRVTAAASTNATLVKGGPGVLYGWTLADNVSPAAAHGTFFKFYDKATTPVPGTDTPLFVIPLISTTTYAAIAEQVLDAGIKFVNGIGFAITGAVADSDTTVATAHACDGVLFYR